MRNLVIMMAILAITFSSEVKAQDTVQGRPCTIVYADCHIPQAAESLEIFLEKEKWVIYANDEIDSMFYNEYLESMIEDNGSTIIPVTSTLYEDGMDINTIKEILKWNHIVVTFTGNRPTVENTLKKYGWMTQLVVVIIEE